MKGSFCSEMSARVGEGIAGSAVAGIQQWILLEYREPWADKAYEKSTLTPAVRAHLDNALSRLGITARLQFLRREDRAQGPLTLYLADTRPGPTRWFRRVSLGSEEALLDIDIEAVFKEGLDVGELVTEPVYFVCTHGKRDRCCALYGRKLYQALREEREEAVWQCSHLGGHRFAPTLLVLPYGLLYGRLQSEDAPGLARACDEGRFYKLETLRGRSVYHAAAQAAESGVLATWPEDARKVDAFMMQAFDTSPAQAQRWTVTFLTDALDVEYTATVGLETVGALRPKSCHKDDTEATRFRVENVHARVLKG